MFLLTILAACNGTVDPTLIAQPDDNTADDLAMQLLHVDVDDDAYNYVVKSRIYPESPETMVLTLRGGGLTFMDLSDPANPTPFARALEGLDVEGQDRIDDTFVVVSRDGQLFTMDVSDETAPELIASVPFDLGPDFTQQASSLFLDVFGGGPFEALHTVLHDVPDGRRIAYVTATASAELLAIDVTDPAQPHQVGAISTDVTFIEGIEIVGNTAWVGGFGSSDLYVGIDVSQPESMEVVYALEHPLYRQMVPAVDRDRDLLYAAMWGDEGGLAIFDASVPEAVEPIVLFSDERLGKANRVKLDGDLAWLPLEQDPGGFAAIDVSDPSQPALVALERDIDGVSLPYTAQPYEGHLYVWGTDENSMAVFRFE